MTEINEEFDESDVVFTGNNVDDGDRSLKCFTDSDPEESRRVKRKKVEKKRTKTKAVDIPESFAFFHYMKPSLFEYEDEDEEELVPPHVMVRRRVVTNMAFSVCSGVGRTLKGRDLSEMRNSVLRMTGFLET
ncbi:unnamed protein product [Lactuca saligna]|uniref:Senescence regulator n=1 Tax=Lactuca saligna TaxID=75948 RepID=A0AA36EGS1_LACSI|nr:unnamed protein product [Lactuca saligna]